MSQTCRILAISGSLRKQSTNQAVLRTAEISAPPDVVVSRYNDLAELPAFNQDDDVDPLPPAVAALRHEVRSADAVLFSTPEYAGALPGSFKNLLDWLIGDDQPGSIYEKPVAWNNASPRGAELAHASLRTVLGYAHADIVEAACLHIPVTAADISDDGLIVDPGLRAEVAESLAQLAAHVARLRSDVA